MNHRISGDVPSAGPRAGPILFVSLVGAVAVARLWFCAQVPVNTTDLLRSLHTGLWALEEGWGVAGVPLGDLDPTLRGVGWARIPYAYPPLVLPFFTLVAGVAPTLFAAKLVLTCIEAVNAMILGRITGSRWLAAIYWASPASVWWVSGEGQFEPLMALCMFGAVALVRVRPVWALAVLGLGVDVKLTALLLAPWCLTVVRRERPERLRASLVAFAGAVVVPLLAASLWYGVLEGLLAIPGSLRYNPYWWNPLDRAAFLWNPGWLVSANAVATYGVLAVMLWRAWRAPGGWSQYGGAIAFVVLVKVSTLAQFWYFVLFPAFVMPVEDRGPSGVGPGMRWWLVALTPLLDLRSFVELVFGPFGWVEVRPYWGIDAFTDLSVDR